MHEKVNGTKRKNSNKLFIKNKRAKYGKHETLRRYKKSFVFMFTFTGKTMRGDPRQSLSTHVAKGGPGVRAGVPVMHP